MSSIIKVDQIQLADGSTPTAGDLGLNVTGSVLQTLQTSSSSDVSTTSTSFVDTDLSVNITPSSTSSKILVFYYTSVRKQPGDINNAVFIQLLRDSTVITAQDYVAWNEQSQYGQEGVSVCHLDSPSTTSQITYKVQYKTNNASYSVSFSHDTSEHGIVVQEIAG